MQDRPSVTAQGSATHRALHQLVDVPLVFEDPLALPILGARRARELRAAAGTAVVHPGPGRAFVVARSRYTEDCLAESAVQGVHQYVLLGAGFDTFAHRNRDPQLRVFEVDHPATQQLKRARVAEAKIGTPDSLIYVPLNFESGALLPTLMGAGFDASAPTVFAWLGVTVYLKPALIFEMLSSLIQPGTRGSQIILDYAGPLTGLAPAPRARFEAMAQKARRNGEPYQSFFEREEMVRGLRDLGAARVDILAPPDLNARYFSLRTDGLATRGPGHLAHARW